MITTLKQAKAVQERRFEARKAGYAKAVRRFLKQEHTFMGQLDVYGYRNALGKLSVRWNGQKVKK